MAVLVDLIAECSDLARKIPNLFTRSDCRCGNGDHRRGKPCSERFGELAELRLGFFGCIPGFCGTYGELIAFLACIIETVLEIIELRLIMPDLLFGSFDRCFLLEDRELQFIGGLLVVRLLFEHRFESRLVFLVFFISLGNALRCKLLELPFELLGACTVFSISLLLSLELLSVRVENRPLIFEDLFKLPELRRKPVRILRPFIHASSLGFKSGVCELYLLRGFRNATFEIGYIDLKFCGKIVCHFGLTSL